MKVIVLITIIVSGIFLKSGNLKEVGEKCIDRFSRQEGLCRLISKCSHALLLLKTKRSDEITNCGFNKITPIVCCPKDNTTGVSANNLESPDFGINPNVNSKCSLYYNARKGYGRARSYNGEGKSLAKEFPHMAIIGYGNPNNIQWLCAGSLISEKFVLTASHCFLSSQYGKATYVRLGDFDITNSTDDAQPQDFSVAETIAHPYYQSNSNYHNIGLIKLHRFADFSEYVKPICLFIQPDVKDNDQLFLTGWTKPKPNSHHLCKFNLSNIPYDVCCEKFLDGTKFAKLPEKIVDEIQICAGGQSGKYKCSDGTGGDPLQISQHGNKFYWSLVGITSMGSACKDDDGARIYTRVAPYVFWIESIVWPD